MRAQQIEVAAKESKNAEVVLAPPFPFLEGVKREIISAKLGAQNVSWESEGAYTGEVSAGQLKSMKVEYVIVGHSERRRLLGETDEMINKKVRAVFEAGLRPIVCVGELAEIRKRGIEAAKKLVEQQLTQDFEGIGNWELKIENLAVAYEPLWAIGTGNADTPAEAAAMANFIKLFLASHFSLSTRVLYGGSVNATNAAQFFKEVEIDGALVGGASIDPVEFAKIIVVA